MSLRRNFIAAFSCVLTTLALLAAGFSFFSAREEAWNILDFQLQQIARIVGDGSGLAPQTDHGDASDERVAVRVTFSDARPDQTNDPTIDFPQREEGFSTFRDDGDEWRLYTMKPDTTRTIMVAQRTAERDEVAADSAWNSAWPFLLAIPLSWLVTYWLAGSIMERLQLLAERVRARELESTTALALAEVPVEVRPLVEAINHAFDRVRRALEQQRAFLADAAHELRTPIAALSLQLANFKAAHDRDDREAAIRDLDAGIRRAAKVTAQLLKLARSDGPDVPERRRVSLRRAAEDCLARFIALADAKNIDLGIARSAECTVDIDPMDLDAILDVLLDNALRYTPDFGKVDIEVTDDRHGVGLTVTDNGPGIPAGLRDRVFDRFYRIDPSKGDGSGLGLAIAQNLMQRYGGSIRLEDAESGRGLKVILQWPAASGI